LKPVTFIFHGGVMNSGITDVILGFFQPDHDAQTVHEAVMGCAVAQPGAQVVLGQAEEADADLDVGGQSLRLQRPQKRLIPPLR
jgi:hypothetical protein